MGYIISDLIAAKEFLYSGGKTETEAYRQNRVYLERCGMGRQKSKKSRNAVKEKLKNLLEKGKIF